VLALERLGERDEVVVARRVELQDRRRRPGQGGGGALGGPPRAPVARQEHLRAGQLRLAGRGEGDAPLREHPGDEDALALEDHAGPQPSEAGSCITRLSLSDASGSPRWLSVQNS